MRSFGGAAIAACGLVAFVACGSSRSTDDDPHPVLRTTTGIIPYILEGILYDVPGDQSIVSYAPAGVSIPGGQWQDASGANIPFTFTGAAPLAIPATASGSATALGTGGVYSLTNVPAAGELDPGSVDPRIDEFVLLVNVPYSKATTAVGASVDVDMTAGTALFLDVAQLEELAGTSSNGDPDGGFAAADPATIIVTNPANRNGLTLPDLIHPADAAALLLLDPRVQGLDITQSSNRFLSAYPESVSLTQPQPGDPDALTVTVRDTTTSTAPSGVAPLFTLTLATLANGSPGQIGDTFSVAFGEGMVTAALAVSLTTDNSCLAGSASLYVDRAFGSAITGPTNIVAAPACTPAPPSM